MKIKDLFKRYVVVSRFNDVEVKIYARNKADALEQAAQEKAKGRSVTIERE